jgi:hypothetical protein
MSHGFNASASSHTMKLPRFTARRLMIVVSIVMTSLAVVFWRPFIISYHEKKMASDWRTVERIGASDDLQGKYIFSTEYHREALVRLGHFERRVIPLKYLQVRSSEAKVLWAALNRRAAGLPVVTMQGYEPETPASIVVWAKPESMVEWEAIVAKYDRPFLSDPKPEMRNQ